MDMIEAENICFEDVAELAEEIVDTIEESEYCVKIGVVGKYDEIESLLAELVTYGFTMDSVDLHSGDYLGYKDEYFISARSEDAGYFVSCAPMKHGEEYVDVDADTIYIFDNSCSRVTGYCHGDSVYFVCLCGECDCCCCEDDSNREVDLYLDDNGNVCGFSASNDEDGCTRKITYYTNRDLHADFISSVLKMLSF